jgi:hypothetical protein
VTRTLLPRALLPSRYVRKPPLGEADTERVSRADVERYTARGLRGRGAGLREKGKIVPEGAGRGLGRYG